MKILKLMRFTNCKKTVIHPVCILELRKLCWDQSANCNDHGDQELHHYLQQDSISWYLNKDSQGHAPPTELPVLTALGFVSEIPLTKALSS